MLDGLDDLPREIFIHHIFQFLENKKDFLNLELVCRKFHSILLNEYLFRSLCLNKWKECFVIHLDEDVMKKFYDGKFRKMFFLNNKFRFYHYTITDPKKFRNPSEVRRYDEENKTDIENQLLQGTLIYTDVPNYYSEDRFKEDGINYTLEEFHDEQADSSDCYASIQIFVPQRNPMDENDQRVDHRFPKFYLVYSFLGGLEDDFPGYVFEENSKAPILEIYDESGTMEMEMCVFQSLKIENMQRFEDPMYLNKEILEPLYESFEEIYLENRWEQCRKLNPGGVNGCKIM